MPLRQLLTIGLVALLLTLGGLLAPAGGAVRRHPPAPDLPQVLAVLLEVSHGSYI
jgi:hypothetical protein